MEQKEFGRRLQAVRHKLGLTQSEVAENVGVGFLTISRMEPGGQRNRSLGSGK